MVEIVQKMKMNECLKNIVFEFVAVLLTLCFFSENFVIYADDYEELNTDFGAIVTSETLELNELITQLSFTGPSGHGFAAEEGNNLIDTLVGNNTTVVGYDNVKNGPDRLIIGRDGTKIFIQDKYYSSASESINACFDEHSGLFKYLNSDGSPMQIEVPSDQYDTAVQAMRKKILDNKVPGITDPDEAENLVRKGHLSYKQAVNLAKAGTIESLTYDAARGCVTAASAFGIATTIDFAGRILNGEEWRDALKESSIIGLKIGASSFAITVISGQLTKAGASALFKPSTDALVAVLGDNFANNLLQIYGTNVSAANAAKTASKLLQQQALVSTVTVVVLTIPDAIDLIRGRISAKQLFKDLAVTLAGVAGATVGGYAGGAAGTAIAPGVGNAIGIVVGSTAGGMIASAGAEAVLNIFFEDDAEEMLNIIQDEFYKIGVDYLATEEEAEEAANQLAVTLSGETLRDMFASEDRIIFADNLIEPLFINISKNRKTISVPTNAEMRNQLKSELQGVIYIH